jgi:hypothetical protein
VSLDEEGGTGEGATDADSALGGLDDLIGGEEPSAGTDETGGNELEDLTASHKRKMSILNSSPIVPKENKYQYNYIEENDDLDNEDIKEIDFSKLSILDSNAPLKVDSAISNVFKNIKEKKNVWGSKLGRKKRRKKVRSHGYHDFNAMLSHKDSRDSLKDPYGRKTESQGESPNTPPKLTYELVKTLDRMNKVFGSNISKSKNSLLTESEGGEPDGEA